MSPIRSLLPYEKLPDNELSKASAPVATADKRTVIAALGDDSLLTLIIQKAFEHTAAYIRANNIVSYDPSSHDKLIQFVCHRADTRTAGQASTHPVTGRVEGVQCSDTAASSEPTGDCQGDQGRDGVKREKGVKRQDKGRKR